MAGKKKQGQEKKKRWSEKRKEKENAKLAGLGNSKNDTALRKALKQVAKIPGTSATTSPKEKHEQGGDRKRKKKAKWKEKQEQKKRNRLQKDGVPDGAPKKKKRMRQKIQRVDDVGDTVVEHNFDDSDDEEEEEIRRAAAEQRRQEALAAAKGKRQVFVSNLPWTASTDVLKKMFAKCGEIEEFLLPNDSMGRPKGIAFVTFKTETAVAKALQCDGRDYEARKMSVQIALPKTTRKKAKGKGKGKHVDSDDSEALCSDDDSS